MDDARVAAEVDVKAFVDASVPGSYVLDCSQRNVERSQSRNAEVRLIRQIQRVYDGVRADYGRTLRECR